MRAFHRFVFGLWVGFGVPNAWAAIPSTSDSGASSGFDFTADPVRDFNAEAVVTPWQPTPAETAHPLIEAVESAPFRPDRVAPGALSASPARLQEAQTLRTQADEKGQVLIIVQMNQSYSFEPNLERLPDGADRIAAQRTRLAEAQQEVVTALSGRQERVRPYVYTPFVSMRVDAVDLSRLLDHPLVAGIEENRLNFPSLAESVPIVRANEAWSAGYTGSGQTVAVLDTGVDKTHPFLSGKVIAEACFSTTDSQNGVYSLCPNGQDQQSGSGAGVNCSSAIDAGCKHGTHVAGIATGKGDTFSGVAKDASVIAVQVFSEFTLPADCGDTVPCTSAYTDDLNQGLSHVYSLRSNQVIASVNMSLGGGKYSSQSACDSERASTKAQIDLLRSAGIATVIASGNDGYTDGLEEPGCISTAISVGATWDVAGYKNSSCDTDWSVVDKVACWSNSASFLDLLAPGIIINSSVPGGGYENLVGTSMAAPHVAGCWALLKQKAPSATVSEIETALKTTGKAVTDWRNGLVTPRIDCKAALDNLVGGGQPDFVVTSISLTPSAPTAGGTFSATVTVQNQGSVAGSAGFLDIWTNQPSSRSCSDTGDARTAVGSLAAGASQGFTFNNLSAGTAGNKTFRAFVDSQCSTTESNEGNNQSTQGYNVGGGGQADFVVTSINLSPSSPTAGGTFNATVTVQNQGSVAGDGGRVDIWLNQSATQSCGAVGNYQGDVGTLAAGESKNFLVNGAAAGTAGTKTMRAFVDSACATAESNESNNQSTQSYSVGGGGQPDFVVTSISLTPASPTAGGTFNATVTVQNQGNAAGDGGRVDIWLNQSATQSCGAAGNYYGVVGTLAAGESKNFLVQGAAAGAAGTKTMRAFVDSACATAESNEGNNQTTKDYSVGTLGSGSVDFDFDGDGKADILWRNSSTGENWLYLMNGSQIKGSYPINTVSNLNWKIVGVGDFNGDHKADILWRNAATGENWMYLMNGATILHSQPINTVSNLNWKIVGVADFDGDGQADILWRNSASGENWLYLMDGASIHGSHSINTVANLNWQIQGRWGN